MSVEEAVARAAAEGDQEALAKYLDGVRAVFGKEGALGPHLGQQLGIEMLEVKRDRVVMRLPYRQELARPGGILHGGAIMALADHAAGCVFMTDPRLFVEGETGLTTDFHASFLRAAAPGEAIVAEATVLRRGRTVSFIAVDVRGEASGKAVTSVRTTYATVKVARVGRRD